MQNHTRLTSINKRPAGHRPNYSGSRSSHSRNSSRNKRSRKGSKKRTSKDQPYQPYTDEDDVQNTSECQIHEIDVTNGDGNNVDDTTIEIATEEEEPRTKSRRAQNYRRAKRNPRVD